MNHNGEKTMRYVLAFILYLFLAVPAFAAEFFAHPNGSGSTCSAGSPCTLTEAINQACSGGGGGDIVTLQDGVYSEEFNSQCSGSNGDPLIIRGENFDSIRPDTTNGDFDSTTSWGAEIRRGSGNIALICHSDITVRGIHFNMQTTGGSNGGFRINGTSCPDGTVVRRLIFEDNRVQDARASCMHNAFGAFHDSIIRYNDIGGCGFQEFWGEAFYWGDQTLSLCSTRASTGILVHHNDVHDFTEQAIDFNVCSDGHEFRNNTFRDQATPEDRGIGGSGRPQSVFIVGGKNHDIHHNLVLRPKKANIAFIGVCPDSGHDFHHNIIIDGDPSGTNQVALRAIGFSCNENGVTTTVRQNTWYNMPETTCQQCDNPNIAINDNIGLNHNSSDNTTDSLSSYFVDADNATVSARDYTTVEGSTPDTGGDGALDSIPVISGGECGAIDSTTCTLTVTNDADPPVREPDVSLIDIEYNSVAQTENSVTVSGSNTLQVAMASAATDTDPLSYSAGNAAYQDSARIGNMFDTTSRSESGSLTNNIDSSLTEITGLVADSHSPDPLAEDIDNLFDDCLSFTPADNCTAGIGTSSTIVVTVDLDNAGAGTKNLAQLRAYGDDQSSWVCNTWDAESCGTDSACASPTTLFTGADCSGRQFWTQNFTAVDIRYVRVTFHGGTGTQVAELEAYETSAQGEVATISQTHGVVKRWDGAIDHTDFVCAEDFAGDCDIAQPGKVRVRLKLSATGDNIPVQGYRLQMNTNGGAYSNVSDDCATTDITFADHPTIDNLDATSEQLTNDHATNITGTAVKEPASIPQITFSDGSETEIEAMLSVCDGATQGNVHCFQFVDDGGNEIDNYAYRPCVKLTPGNLSGVF